MKKGNSTSKDKEQNILYNNLQLYDI